MLDLQSVSNELVLVMAKWYRIGVQLGVNEARLEEIENDYQATNRRFSEVIRFWLRGNALAAVSWESLIEVLETPSVCEEGLAMKLREKGGMFNYYSPASPSVMDPPPSASPSSSLSAMGPPPSDSLFPPSPPPPTPSSEV